MIRARVGVAIAVMALIACAYGPPPPFVVQGEPELVHIHALANNPADGLIYAATHTGIYQFGPSGAFRVAGPVLDAKGLAVLGPDQFLASGHPGPSEHGPSDVGLVRSDNAGGRWTPVSLLGVADFHAMSAAGASLYGWDAVSRAVLRSDDDGLTWTRGAALSDVGALAADPDDGHRVLAATPQGLLASSDGGLTFGPAHVQPPRPLVLIAHAPRVGGGGDTTLAGMDATGTPWTFDGATWMSGMSAGGPPQAFTVLGPDRYVTATDRAVRSSEDAGMTWTDVAPAA